MYHYVYRLDHIETNEFYIGVRTSKVKPELDPYLGSMKIWNPDKSKLIKTIIKYGFASRADANYFEATEITKVIKDVLNRNYHIPPNKFCVQGYVTVKDSSGNFYKVEVTDPRFLSGELTIYNKGLKMPKYLVDNHVKIIVDKKYSWYHNDLIKECKWFKTTDVIPAGWMKGRKMYNYIQSEETKAKRANSNTGQTRSDETKSKIAYANSKRVLSEDTKNKIRDSKLNLSEEARLNMSISARKRKATDIAKLNMSIAQRKRFMSKPVQSR